MPLAPSHTLREIIDFCAYYLPALSGEVCAPEHCLPDEADRQIGGIFKRLANAYPQAQQVYWGCRTWQLWLWQPVFIGVWSSSVKGVSIEFYGFRHRMGDLFTDRFVMVDQNVNVQNVSLSVFQTALHLKQWLVRELALIQPYYKMNEKLAGYFLADAVLQALAAAHRFGLLDRQQTSGLEKMWQTALDMRCFGRLVWQENAREFLVETVSCCQHFRREGADYCTGCPKLRQSCGCGRS